ncbi:helix-turn-helix transcriptional regulator [Nonomuraea sp. NPDC005650]|uniref:helix-turn-helix domain-containing protein n=1 Tax=Nonomuraea sp. NPDC005650 TaxID=3157045 RepID=UPI0033B8C6E5
MLADLVRAHRGRARLTQEELAERASLSVRALRDLERGRTRFPRRTSLRRLAAALDLTDADRVAFEAITRGPVLPAAEAGPWELPAVSRSVLIERVPLLREVEDAVSHASGAGHPAVVAVTGGTGWGKTTLAVHSAHLLRARMAVESFYVDLRSGHFASRTLAADLRHDRTEHTMRFGSRGLLVLDNADGSETVHSLLGLGFTAVIVTSRERLPGLSATADIALTHPR